MLIRFVLCFFLARASNWLESFSMPHPEALRHNPEISIIREIIQKLSNSCILHYMLLAYFRIRYHRLEVAKKWISKAVLFRQVFRWSLAVLLPHCILEILESFWVPQSLWLESWKFSFVFVLVREGWALSGSPTKRTLNPKSKNSLVIIFDAT